MAAVEATMPGPVNYCFLQHCVLTLQPPPPSTFIVLLSKLMNLKQN